MIRLLALALLCLAATGVSAPSRAASPAAGTITPAELLQRTRQLYAASDAGDPKPWQAWFADDAVVYDEKGRSMDKQALVADIGPMPAGYSVHMRVVDPHVILTPNAAAVAYACDESETAFGQTMHARYHTVDTWMFRHGTWQIVASQTMRYYEDPKTGTTDVAHLDDFTGDYALTPSMRRTVTREGNALFVQKGTGPKTELLPESGDLFFRKGVEGRVLFQRDAHGKVDAMDERRNNEDIVWKRVHS